MPTAGRLTRIGVPKKFGAESMSARSSAMRAASPP
jgi:hypothetical protein